MPRRKTFGIVTQRWKTDSWRERPVENTEKRKPEGERERMRGRTCGGLEKEKEWVWSWCASYLGGCLCAR